MELIIEMIRLIIVGIWGIIGLVGMILVKLERTKAECWVFLKNYDCKELEEGEEDE